MLGYYSSCIGVLTGCHGTGNGTVSGGQFDWGGRLPKSNGGAQRYPQLGWKSSAECKGIRAVSYTHLDVYKRQMRMTLKGFVMMLVISLVLLRQRLILH